MNKDIQELKTLIILATQLKIKDKEAFNALKKCIDVIVRKGSAL